MTKPKLDDAYLDAEGVWRWKSNDRVPFDDVLVAGGVAGRTLELCQEARRVETAAAIVEYGAQRDRMSDSERAAEAAEALAAFGEGPVVNIITGERIL